MTKMTNKDYLKLYQSLKAEKANLISERNGILADEALPKGMDYSADKIQASPADNMFSIHMRIEKRSRIIDSRLILIQDKMEEICDAVNAIDDGVGKRLLWLRYIDDKDWRDVAKELQYEIDHVKGALHQKALNKLKIPQKNTQ